MTEIIINYITNQLTNEELDEELDIHDDLLSSGLLDSLAMIKLVVFIENELNIKVPPEDMTIENFMTVNHITQYLSDK